MGQNQGTLNPMALWLWVDFGGLVVFGSRCWAFAHPFSCCLQDQKSVLPGMHGTLFIQVRAIAPSTDHPPGRKAQVSSRGRPVWCLWARPRESPSRNQGISCDSGRITTLLRGSSKKKGHTNFPRKPERGYWNILEPSHGKSCCLTCRNR